MTERFSDLSCSSDFKELRPASLILVLASDKPSSERSVRITQPLVGDAGASEFQALQLREQADFRHASVGDFGPFQVEPQQAGQILQLFEPIVATVPTGRAELSPIRRFDPLHLRAECGERRFDVARIGRDSDLRRRGFWFGTNRCRGRCLPDRGGGSGTPCRAWKIVRRARPWFGGTWR